jgi:hypothetical protein
LSGLVTWLRQKRLTLPPSLEPLVQRKPQAIWLRQKALTLLRFLEQSHGLRISLLQKLRTPWQAAELWLGSATWLRWKAKMQQAQAARLSGLAHLRRLSLRILCLLQAQSHGLGTSQLQNPSTHSHLQVWLSGLATWPQPSLRIAPLLRGRLLGLAHWLRLSLQTSWLLRAQLSGLEPSQLRGRLTSLPSKAKSLYHQSRGAWWSLKQETCLELRGQAHGLLPYLHMKRATLPTCLGAESTVQSFMLS